MPFRELFYSFITVWIRQNTTDWNNRRNINCHLDSRGETESKDPTNMNCKLVIHIISVDEGSLSLYPWTSHWARIFLYNQNQHRHLIFITLVFMCPEVQGRAVIRWVSLFLFCKQTGYYRVLCFQLPPHSVLLYASNNELPAPWKSLATFSSQNWYKVHRK